MKQRDIKPCAVCGKGVMHDNAITFYRVRVTYLVADIRAIQRQHGLELMLGGHAGIAAVMGPNEDMAKPMTEHDALVCLKCAMKTCIAELSERLTEEESEVAES